MPLGEKDQVDALIAAASKDGWDIAILRADGARVATNRATKESCEWVLTGGRDTGARALTVLAHQDKYIAYLVRGKDILKRYIVNDGSERGTALMASNPEPASYASHALERMSRLLCVFGCIQEEFTPSDYMKTYALEYLPLSIVPRDMSLIHRLSGMNLSTEVKSKLKDIDQLLVGVSAKKQDEIIEKTIEFAVRFNRMPINSFEAENVRPLQVRLHRFGVDLPYNVLLPTIDHKTSGFYLKTYGVHKTIQTGGESTIPLVLDFDGGTQMFQEARCKDWPFIERPDGVDRIVDRMAESRSVNYAAVGLESLMGCPLSRMGFKVFASVFTNTFGKQPLHRSFYDPTSGVFMMGSPSNERGIPTRLPMKQLEAYLLTLTKFQTGLQAAKLQNDVLSGAAKKDALGEMGER